MSYAEAACRPRPREPPVTTATLPLREKSDGKSWSCASAIVSVCVDAYMRVRVCTCVRMCESLCVTSSVLCPVYRRERRSKQAIKQARPAACSEPVGRTRRGADNRIDARRRRAHNDRCAGLVFGARRAQVGRLGPADEK